MDIQFPVLQLMPPSAFGVAASRFTDTVRVPFGSGDGAGLGIPPFVLRRHQDADTVLQVAANRLGERISDAIVVNSEDLTGDRMLAVYFSLLRNFPADQRADSLRAAAVEVDFTGDVSADGATDPYRYYMLYLGDGRMPLSIRFNNPLVPSARVESGVVALGSAVSCGGQVMRASALIEMIIALNESDQRAAVLPSVEEAALSLEAGALILADNRGRNRSADVPGEFFGALWDYLGAVRDGKKSAVVNNKYLTFARTLELLPESLLGGIEES